MFDDCFTSVVPVAVISQEISQGNSFYCHVLLRIFAWTFENINNLKTYIYSELN